MELTKKQILELKENKDLYLNEGILDTENILLAAGFIPVIGEIADIISIIRYLMRGERLKAALMLVALIPTVGDIFVKPILFAFKGASKLLTKGGPELSEYIAKNPQLISKFKNLGQYVSDSRVTQTVSKITNVNKGWGSGLREGLDTLKNLSVKYSGQVGGGLKAGAKSLAAGKSFAGGLKGYFQGQRLSKYFAKNGVLPSNALSRWWQNVLARKDRRLAFSKFLIGNNLLDKFGIPNINSLDNWMEDEDNLNKLAEDPATSDFIAQNSSQQDFVGGQQTASDDGGGVLGGAMNLFMLKYLARFIA
jgi:hypothetical protein